MLHHHKHGIKQSIFAFIVVFLACTGMFLALRPNLYSSASPKNPYIPPEGAVLEFPDGNGNTATPVSKESISKSPNIYTVQPMGLPRFKVTSVVDGNTVILEGITRVRLIGIKAPDQDEEYGIEATDFLKTLVEGRDVYFQLDDQNPRDDLGRLRGIIYVDNKNVNIEIVRAGLAHIFPTTPSIVGYNDWMYFWNEAREAKRGMWSGERPQLKTSIPSDSLPVVNQKTNTKK